MSYSGELTWLQTWYQTQCNGEWEHSAGISIESTDNPGWWVKIHLAGTSCEQFAGDQLLLVDPPGAEAGDRPAPWIVCRIQAQRFDGAGDPAQLSRILRVFREWAERVLPRDSA